MQSLEMIQQRLADYLTLQWQTPVQVLAISQIFGGASRDTYRLRVATSQAERGLIVRRDPPSSLIETERALEYGAYLAMLDTDIPVPAALFLENDPAWLGQPFSIMAEVAAGIGVSRATAQRYLAALATSDEVKVGLRYGATGRPEQEFVAKPTVSRGE